MFESFIATVVIVCLIFTSIYIAMAYPVVIAVIGFLLIFAYIWSDLYKVMHKGHHSNH